MSLPSPVAQPRPSRQWALRIRVRISRRQLERRLAKGEEAASHPALALRATQLVEPRSRECLAAHLERLVVESRTRGRELSAAAPIAYGRVVASRDELRAIADSLRAPKPVQARGVAMLATLLTDAASPLFAPSDGDLFELYLESVKRHLVQGPA